MAVSHIADYYHWRYLKARDPMAARRYYRQWHDYRLAAFTGISVQL